MRFLKINNYLKLSLFINIFHMAGYADDFSNGVFPFLNSEPRSLSAQKLTLSSYPEEAELFCSFEQCALGLTKGLIVGGDAAGMLYAPFRQYFDSNWDGGSLYIIDVFGGFQIVRDTINQIYMNAQIGYRRIHYKNDNNITVNNQGITAKVNYSQLITPIYLQGLQFSAYFSGNSSTNNQQAISQDSQNHENFSNATNYFYRISQKYPTYQFSLPADIEIANWNKTQTELNSPVRVYAHLEPFYIQNNLNFNYNNIALQKTEQNYGIRVAATGAYESVRGNDFGRFAVITSLGLDFSTSTVSTTQSGNSDVSIPQRQWIAPYVNLGGSWQF